MNEKNFLVIEYAPSLLDNREFAPVRMDGHYSDRQAAEKIAEGWAEETVNKGTRIVVAEISAVVKDPAYWNKSK